MPAFGVVLPDGFYFLQTGWWVVHVVAIAFIFLVGYLVGARKSVGVREARGKEAYRMAQIPLGFRFLRAGWWVIHIVAIVFVFVLGAILRPW